MYLFQGLGASFIIYGTLIYHVLDTFFLDNFGLETTGTIAYLSIAVGTVMVLVSFTTNFVIMYPSTKSYGMLAMIYGLTLVFVLLFCIIGFFYTPNMNGVMRVGVRNIMQNYNAKSVMNIYLDALHAQLKCCGAEDYTSWFRTSWAGGKKIVPVSCCKNLKYCHNLEPLIVTDIQEKDDKTTQNLMMSLSVYGTGLRCCLGAGVECRECLNFVYQLMDGCVYRFTFPKPMLTLDEAISGLKMIS
ncbi:tetraspanin-36-like [Argiope bruennichi]|uniref:tetraspanin-36-like n=1 Tax=Argiope bruennichi TaxID=94029 RepID=UPI0024954AD8|nr:tetraspanin-36-like [Argiope bruennichi]